MNIKKLIQEQIKEYILYKGDIIRVDEIPVRLKQDDLIEGEDVNIKLIDLLPGGYGDTTKDYEVDQNELIVGIEVEMEHTDDRRKAKEIAIDHLIEDPKYYTKLIAAGLVDEPKAIELYHQLFKKDEIHEIELNEDEKQTRRTLKKAAWDYWKNYYEPLINWSKKKISKYGTPTPQLIHIVRYPDWPGVYGLGVEYNEDNWKNVKSSLVYLSSPMDRNDKKFMKKYPFIQHIRKGYGDKWKTSLWIWNFKTEKHTIPDYNNSLTIKLT